MADGDIDAVLNNDYFAVKGRATNTNASMTVDFIWRAKGTPQEKAQRKVLKEFGSKKVIDVHKLMDQISRRMPKAEDENKAVRPQK